MGNGKLKWLQERAATFDQKDARATWRTAIGYSNHIEDLNIIVCYIAGAHSIAGSRR